MVVILEEAQVLKIQDIMTKNPITISPNDSVGHTMDIFDRYHIKSIPVVYNDELVGMVTKQDVFMKSTNRQEKISDVMSKDLLTVSPDDDLVKAIEMIKTKNIFEIMVAKYNKLVGVLSVSDIINKLKAKKS